MCVVILAACVCYADVVLHVFILGVDDRAVDVLEVP
jgi:hypothetical protein